MAKDSSQAFRGGVPALVASLRLSDFASGGGTSKRPRSAPSAASQSCRLSDFASVRTVRAKQGKPADHKKFQCFKEDLHTWRQLSGKLQSRVVSAFRLHDASPKLATKRLEKVRKRRWSCGFAQMLITAGKLGLGRPIMQGRRHVYGATLSLRMQKRIVKTHGDSNWIPLRN